MALETTPATGAPLSAVAVTFPSARPAGETELEATLGDEPVTITVTDDREGAFTVPEVSDGARQLEVTLSSDEVGVATFEVLPPPVVENPEEVTRSAVDEVNTSLKEVKEEMREGVLADQGAGEEQAQAIERWSGEIEDLLATATPDELEEVALFLEANAHHFGGGSRTGSAATTHENVEERVDAFLRDMTPRQTDLATAAIACGATSGLSDVAAALARAACAGFVYARAQSLSREIRTFVQNQPAVPSALELTSPETSSEGGIELEHGVPQALGFQAPYRPFQSGDRGAASDLFRALDSLLRLWDRAMSLVPEGVRHDSFDIDQVGQGELEIVNLGAGEVTFGGAEGDGISCSAEDADGGLEVECRNESAEPVAATLDFDHGNAFGQASAAVAATVRGREPAQVEIVAGDGQEIEGTGEFPDALEARVLDGAGEPIPDVPVTWRITSEAGVVVSSEERTDDSGTVRATVEADAEGEIVVEVVAEDSDGEELTASFTLSSLAALPAQVEIVAGDGQEIAGAGEFPDALEARVLDDAGEPIPDVPVAWRITSEVGVLVSSEERTDDSGTARATVEADAEGEIVVEVAAEDGDGEELTATFTLLAEELWATVDFEVREVEVLGTEPRTEDGVEGTKLTCAVSVWVTIEGNATVHWEGWHWYTYDVDAPEYDLEVSDELDFSTEAPAENWWIREGEWWWWWGGDHVGSFNTTYTVTYRVEGEEESREQSVSWTCSQ